MARRLVAVAAVLCALTGAVAAPATAAGVAPWPGLHHVTLPVDRAGSGPLTVFAQDTDPARPGEVTTVHAAVRNNGGTKANAFTVVVTLPVGASPEGPFFPENCAAADRTVTCHFRSGLPAGNTATALIPARIATYATGVLNDGTVTVTDDTDPDAVDTESFDIAVADEVLTD